MLTFISLSRMYTYILSGTSIVSPPHIRFKPDQKSRAQKSSKIIANRIDTITAVVSNCEAWQTSAVGRWRRASRKQSIISLRCRR